MNNSQLRQLIREQIGKIYQSKDDLDELEDDISEILIEEYVLEPIDLVLEKELGVGEDEVFSEELVHAMVKVVRSCIRRTIEILNERRS